MNQSKRPIIIAVLLIIVGLGWLLNTLDMIPDLDWVWILALAGIGLLTLALGGINKLTVVVGPLLLIAAVLSLLRQVGRLTLNHEVPILMIALGVLMLIAYVSPIPAPEAPPPPRPHE